jgi:hypothetical protein
VRQLPNRRGVTFKPHHGDDWITRLSILADGCSTAHVKPAQLAALALPTVLATGCFFQGSSSMPPNASNPSFPPYVCGQRLPANTNVRPPELHRAVYFPGSLVAVRPEPTCNVSVRIAIAPPGSAVVTKRVHPDGKERAEAFLIRAARPYRTIRVTFTGMRVRSHLTLRPARRASSS